MAQKANNPENLKPFKKGESGNPKGRPRKLPEIDEMLINVFDRNSVISILTALRKKAISGDARSIELTLDRLYGKLKQANELSFDLKKLSDSEVTELIERLFKTKKDV